MPSVRTMIGEGRPIRVLMVEDEPVLGQFGVRLLEKLGGMEAVLAEDGLEGLELAWSWRPDVILLDLIMPVMSGVELLMQYRREGGTAKVLVITGGDLEKVKGTVLALGADEVVGKPVCWGGIMEYIQLMVGGLEERCRALLKRMGANAGGKGFEQTVECAALLGEKKCVLLKEAYVEVARRQKTGVTSVSKNIERLAKDVHQGGTSFYYEFAGRERGDPPLTNREFLDLLSQAARIPL